MTTGPELGTPDDRMNVSVVVKTPVLISNHPPAQARAPRDIQALLGAHEGSLGPSWEHCRENQQHHGRATGRVGSAANAGGTGTIWVQ